MNTCMIKDVTKLEEAAKILQSGGLVASPTETVYGLCANALDEVAVSHIYEAKGRPSDNPLIVHIATLEMLPSLVLEVSDIAKRLIEHFWPGPLTLIFKASPRVPKIVTGGLDTVAIRFPSHPVMQRLINTSGLPLAAPSANTSGKPSPTNAKRVLEDLEGKIDAVIMGESCEYGVESTVVDTIGEVATILRPGGITYDMLESVLGKVAMDPALGHPLEKGEKPKAPGMKYTHYSPNAKVIIVKGIPSKLPAYINTLVASDKAQGKKVGVLATDELFSKFQADLVLSCGSISDLNTVSAKLFEALRLFDDAHMDVVYSLAFPKEGIGEAIMNRLEKSAGYHIIEL